MIKYTLFTSDVHLKSGDRGREELFLKFLNWASEHGETLYLLGDIFDAYLGNDDPDPVNKRSIDALKKCAAKIPLYYILGNHDFLVDKKVFKETKIKKLSDIAYIELYGERISLTHGDLLCINDHLYQIVRKIYKNRICQRLFLLLPLFIRRGIANFLKGQEQAFRSHRPLSKKLSPDDRAIVKMMEQHKTQKIIYGHTHWPKIEILENDKIKEKKIKIALGTWSANKGSYLKIGSDGSFKLESFV